MKVHPALLAVLAVVGAAYLAVVQAGFAWDDNGILVANEALSNPSFEKIFLKDLWCCVRGHEGLSPYYRPLTTLSFLLDYKLGLIPGLAHLHSLLWHMVVVTLVYVLLQGRLGMERAAAGALVFGLHPIQSEAVVWIAARNDLMGTAGVIGTLILLERRSNWAALPLAAACLCKESSYTFPAVLLCWRLAFPGERSYGKELLVVAPGLVLTFLLRSMAELGPVPSEYRDLGPFFEWLPRWAGTVLGWLVLPWPLTTTASLYRPLPGPSVLISAVLAVAFIIVILWRNGKRGLALLGLGAVGYAPAVGAVVSFSILGERYLYQPMFAFAALFAGALPERLGGRTWALLGLWATYALVLLHFRLPDWATAESLMRAAAERAPDSYSFQLLGSQLQQQGEEDEALDLYDRSFDYQPPRLFACKTITELAVKKWTMARLDSRLPRLVEVGCRSMNGFDPPVVVALASQRRWGEAEKWLRSAVTVDKDRRDRVVKGAIATVDGNLLLAGSEALIWPTGVAAYREQVHAFTHNVAPLAP